MGFLKIITPTPTPTPTIFLSHCLEFYPLLLCIFQSCRQFPIIIVLAPQKYNLALYHHHRLQQIKHMITCSGCFSHNLVYKLIALPNTFTRVVYPSVSYYVNSSLLQVMLLSCVINCLYISILSVLGSHICSVLDTFVWSPAICHTLKTQFRLLVADQNLLNCMQSKKLYMVPIRQVVRYILI